MVVRRRLEFYKNLEHDIEEDHKSVTEEIQMGLSHWNGNTFGNSEIIVVAAVGTLKKRVKYLQQRGRIITWKIAHMV